MKVCKICGRERHLGLCNMATLTNGAIVHASRIEITDGNEYVDGVLVRNRWIKELSKKEKK